MCPTGHYDHPFGHGINLRARRPSFITVMYQVHVDKPNKASCTRRHLFRHALHLRCYCLPIFYTHAPMQPECFLQIQHRLLSSSLSPQQPFMSIAHSSTLLRAFHPVLHPAGPPSFRTTCSTSLLSTRLALDQSPWIRRPTAQTPHLCCCTTHLQAIMQTERKKKEKEKTSPQILSVALHNLNLEAANS